MWTSRWFWELGAEIGRVGKLKMSTSRWTLKKNIIEKYCFVMEKNYFEKTISENFRYLKKKSRKSENVHWNFFKKIIGILKICNENFHWHFENFQWKFALTFWKFSMKIFRFSRKIFIENFPKYFFQTKFSPWRKNIFRWDFFLSSFKNFQLSNAPGLSSQLPKQNCLIKNMSFFVLIIRGAPWAGWTWWIFCIPQQFSQLRQKTFFSSSKNRKNQ